MLTAPVVLGALGVTIALYLVNRQLASRVAYYTGLVLIVLTGTAVFAGTMYLLTNPNVMQSTELGRTIDQSIRTGLQKGLKNVPNLPSLKNLLTPTP
jgi:formate/nitrite transporter FocA (FNT family)